MALRFLQISFAMLAGLFTAGAQLPVARLHSVLPPGGQIGATFEVAISGADLDDISELRFTDTNIVAKPKMVGETGLPEGNKFVVTISSNALPGTCEARAVGRFGVSNPRCFVLGKGAEAIERGDNHSPEGAMDVAMGTTVNAQADANAFDYFRFSASKGQRVLIECRSRSIDSRMEPLMLLTDSAGRELALARNRDLMIFDVPESGTNVLRVSDLLYRGGADCFYRLTIHAGPRVEFVLPAAALAGTTNKHTLYGWNLPGATPAPHMLFHGRALDRLEVEIVAPPLPQRRLHHSPNALGIDGFEYRFNAGQTTCDPVFISMASGPVVLEAATNETGEAAQRISAPCEIAGQFYPAGDQDWFSFEARKGDVLWLEIFSERLGAPTDPFLVVQRAVKNDKGEVKISDLQETYDSEANIGGQEFKTSSRDPQWRFEVKEDGAYRAQVRDLFNRTSAQPGNIYRLAVRGERPGFSLAVLHALPPTKKERELGPATTVLRAGETLPLKVLAQRRDGFAGEIDLSVEDAPAQIAASPAKIESGKNSALLFVTAQTNASRWGGQIKIVGKATLGSNEIRGVAVEGGAVWRVEDYNTEGVIVRTSPQAVLAIAPEPAPVILGATATNALEAPVGTKLHIPLVVTRGDEFKEKLKIKLSGAPALDSIKELELDAKATNATFELDLGQAKLAAGTHLVYFQTQTKGKYSNNPEGAKAAELAAKEAEAAATALAAEMKKAAEEAAATARAATEAAGALKSAMEKLAAARLAAEANAADPKHAEEIKAAEQVVIDATAKSQSAAEAKVSAEGASVKLAAKLKSAEARKTALAARAKELSEKAKPREVTVAVYSRPFEIKVNPAPATAKK